MNVIKGVNMISKSSPIDGYTQSPEIVDFALVNSLYDRKAI